MGEFIMGMKRLVRPLIPDRVMARYRLHAHSQQSRVNIDVILPEGASERRWLGSTPDTYRAVVPGAAWEHPSDTGRPGASSESPAGRSVVAIGPEAGRAAALFANVACDVGIVGETSEPRLVARRRTEPLVHPSGIAMAPEVLADIGGPDILEKGLAAVLSLVRTAGWRLALEPTGTDVTVPLVRSDAVDRPPVVILAGVPMHDIGGGSRGAQLSAEYVAAGCHVTHVALFGTQESVDLGLRFLSPYLEQEPWDVFDAESFARRAGRPGLCVIDIPAPQFRRPVDILAREGWVIVYDVIDDWSDPALGGEWWDPAVESSFASTADAVIASAPDLVRRMADTGIAATLVPNAVNVDLFTASGPMAEDLPTSGSPILGYHGSLYGDWFDWDGLAAVAEAFPHASIVIIGDDKAPHRALPSNVRFLGLRAQVALPAYVRGFDVGLLPFVTTETTHAVSPLKVYEYLACGVPVAAPPLRALDGMPSVWTAPDLVDAVRRALEAPPVDTVAIAASESWRARIETISAATGWVLPGEKAERPRVEVRPVTHYRRNERVVQPSAGRLPHRDDPS